MIRHVAAMILGEEKLEIRLFTSLISGGANWWITNQQLLSKDTNNDLS